MCLDDDGFGGVDWLSVSPNALKGFSWRGGSKRDTNGILIWSEPFIMKDKNGEEVRNR